MKDIALGAISNVDRCLRYINAVLLPGMNDVIEPTVGEQVYEMVYK
jgi:hypothetical protein